jgi:hypothetical protein
VDRVEIDAVDVDAHVGAELRFQSTPRTDGGARSA